MPRNLSSLTVERTEFRDSVIRGDTDHPIETLVEEVTVDWTHHLIQGQVPEDFVITLFDSTLDRQIDVSDPRIEVVIAMRVKDRDSICERLTTTKLPGFQEPPLPMRLEPPYDVPGSGGRVRVNFTAHSVHREGEFEASIYIAMPGDVPALNTTLAIRVVERSKVPALGFRRHIRI